MATEIDAARLLTLRAAWLKERGAATRKEAAMAKLFASEIAQRVTTRRSRSTAGTVTRRSSRSSGHFRDAQITEIYEGTSEISGWSSPRDLRALTAKEHAEHEDVPGPRRIDGADVREGEKHLPLLKALVEEAIPAWSSRNTSWITSTTVS